MLATVTVSTLLNCMSNLEQTQHVTVVGGQGTSITAINFVQACAFFF
ncbi:unnamed protein product [uncultured virus]|nr:unnamed protein product [uncultured virus]